MLGVTQLVGHEAGTSAKVSWSTLDKAPPFLPPTSLSSSAHSLPPHPVHYGCVSDDILWRILPGRESLGTQTGSDRTWGGWGLGNNCHGARKELFFFLSRVCFLLFVFSSLEVHVAMGTRMAQGAQSHSPA